MNFNSYWEKYGKLTLILVAICITLNTINYFLLENMFKPEYIQGIVVGYAVAFSACSTVNGE